MTIHYNCTGERRKELVHTIAEILECDSKYLGIPTQGYFNIFANIGIVSQKQPCREIWLSCFEYFFCNYFL